MSKLPVKLHKSRIGSFCKKHHIISFALFGSVLTPQFKKTSDVDVLVQFDKKHIPTIFEFIDIETELSDIIGWQVDLKTPNDLSPYFRKEVVANAKRIYGKK